MKITEPCDMGDLCIGCVPGDGDCKRDAQVGNHREGTYAMTTDIKLLPLHLLEAFKDALKGQRGELDAWLEVNNESDVRLHVEAYVAHHVAAKDDEIESLKVEVAAQRTRADAMAGEAIKYEARAKRLAEALRHIRNHTSVNSHQIELIDTALHPTAAQDLTGERNG